MRPPEDQCICPKAMQSLGRLDGIDMGKAMLRTKTVKDCPVHDSCHNYTRYVRSRQPDGSFLYCPHHGKKNCPHD